LSEGVFLGGLALGVRLVDVRSMVSDWLMSEILDTVVVQALLARLGVVTLYSSFRGALKSGGADEK
jgi:hypothetical protein